MEEIKQKVQDLELALNYVCYDVALIPKLSKVWEKLEILQEAVNKKCNTTHVRQLLIDFCEIYAKGQFEDPDDIEGIVDWYLKVKDN